MYSTHLASGFPLMRLEACQKSSLFIDFLWTFELHIKIGGEVLLPISPLRTEPAVYKLSRRASPSPTRAILPLICIFQYPISNVQRQFNAYTV